MRKKEAPIVRAGRIRRGSGGKPSGGNIGAVVRSESGLYDGPQGRGGMTILSAALCFCAICMITVPALAVDSYHFTNVAAEDFYVREPGIEYTVITPEPDIGYGLASETPRNAPGQRDVESNLPHGGVEGVQTTFYIPAETAVSPQYGVTPIADVRKSDGSIGTLKIPKLGLTATVYDGDTYDAMKKGAGHIASTSAWNSNIGLAGHNRGTNPVFSKINTLTAGDTLSYTTTLGTRTYTVTFSGKIAATDWSYLQYTTDNRITLITCVADQPEYRYCVQCAEKR